jgi:AAA+ superfamily predicted ATPase
MNDPLLSSSLKLDNRIVDYLLGFGLIDARLAGLARLILPVDQMASPPVDQFIRGRLSSFARSHLFGTDDTNQRLLFYLRGPAGIGKSSMAQAVCRDLDLPLITADLERVLEASVPFSDAVWLLCREAILQPAALCIENVDCVLSDEKHRAEVRPLLDALGVYTRLTFLLGAQSWRPRGELAEHIFIDQEFAIPSANVRKTLWKSALVEQSSLASDADLGSLASNFQFTGTQIRNAVADARTLAGWRTTGPDGIDLPDLQKACRNQSTTRLSSLARKIEPRYHWQDIVLPEDQLTQLREICVQARHRDIVYGDWGFERKLALGRGLNVLFSGPAGTGKTMAAEVIASDLGLELYKIDLSQVVSKYIGETEKNLNQVFREAKSCYAILFFDEADALFGKRSEVKDAHDRYSNIEIGYLLQKMEEYDGIGILATNLRQNLDEAFVRRLQVIVDFPFPNETYRKLIWDVIFPAESPIGLDVDFVMLAREIKLSGGSIKNIALAAAFFAAEGGGPISMSHLLSAARREYQKLGRIWPASQWSEHAALMTAAQRAAQQNGTGDQP